MFGSWASHFSATSEYMSLTARRAQRFLASARAKAAFVSKEIKAQKNGDDTHVITGDLTLHGETKPVSIPVKVTTTDDAVSLDGKFTIDRMEFGIGKTFGSAAAPI